MAVEGTLDLFQLPEILQVVSQQRKTGILTIQGASDIVAVSFLDGRIVAADSLTETTEEGLGEVLVVEGVIDAATLRRLAGSSGEGGPRLGDLLVSEGHVDRQQLLDALRVHTMRLLMGLLDWRNGEFKFYGGDEVSYEEGFRSIGVDELLLRAVEEQERDSLPEPDARVERRTAEREVRVRDLSVGGEEVLTGEEDVIWLTPEEERVLDEVVSGRPVFEVAQAAKVPLDRVRYTLYRFSREGLVDVAPPPAEPAAPAAAEGIGGPEPRDALDLPDLGVDPAPVAERPSPAGVELAEPGLEPGSEEPAEPRPAPADSPAAEAPPPKRRRPARPAARVSRGPSSAARELPITGLLAVVLLVLLTGGVVLAPSAALRPFPWLEEERAAQRDTRDAVLLLQVDRAARTFFLHEGRFPDRLEDLVELGVLEESDLMDTAGRRLGYEAGEGSYRIEPMTAAADADVRTVREGITGDFLLDPEFLAGRRGAQQEAPLVLLD